MRFPADSWLSAFFDSMEKQHHQGIPLPVTEGQVGVRKRGRSGIHLMVYPSVGKSGEAATKHKMFKLTKEY